MPILMPNLALILRNAPASLAGIARNFRRPHFREVLRARSRSALNLPIAFPVDTPDGFQIEEWLELISYWSMFIQRDLHHWRWVESLRSIPYPVVVDVGANCGVFTRLCRLINPRCHAVMFEPQQRFAAKLFQFGKVHSVALSNREKELRFEEFTTGNGRISDHGTVIKAHRLDDYRLSPHLLKIDVEDHALQVAEGALQTIRGTPHVIIELSERHMLDYIKGQFPEHRWIRLTREDYYGYLVGAHKETARFGNPGEKLRAMRLLGVSVPR